MKNFKFHVKKGDTVKVLSGNDKGSTGKVISVDRKHYRAIVEGVNMVTKHTRPNADNPDGGIITQEASVHLSNLQLVDPKSGEGTRIGRKDVDGKLIRYAKKSGQEI